MRVRVLRTRTYICLPLPQPVVTPPTPSGHSPSHWLRHFPTTTPSGINTPHVPSQSFFIHLPMKMEPTEGSETSAIRTKTPENYPKENILHTEHGKSLKSRMHICFTYHDEQNTRILHTHLLHVSAVCFHPQEELKWHTRNCISWWPKNAVVGECTVFQVLCLYWNKNRYRFLTSTCRRNGQKCIQLSIC